MQLGISTWSFPYSIGIPGHPQPDNPLDAKGLLEKAEEFGVSLVQICDNLPYYKMREDEVRELGLMADNMGISLQLGTRGVNPEHLSRTLELAKILHAAKLRTVVDNSDPGFVAECIEKVLPEFAEAEVCLAVENTEILGAKQFAEIMRNADSDHLGITLDTANSLGRLERLDEVVEALAPYVTTIHYKDFDIERMQQAPPVVRMGFQIVGKPAGEGRVDFDWLVQSISDAGSEPDIILELWPPFLETIEETVLNERDWVEQSMGFLKEKLKGVL